MPSEQYKDVEFNKEPEYSLNYEDFPPFPPPNAEFPPGYAPPFSASGLPLSRRGSVIPADIPGLPKIVPPGSNAPVDRFNFVFIAFSFIGVINMLPLVFFSTANEYWMYKFRTVGSNDTSAASRNYLQANYGSFNMIAVTVTGIICNFFSTFAAHKIRLTTRAYMSLTFFLCNFIVQTILVRVNTDTWQLGFFGITIVIQIVMAILLAIAGTGTITIVSKFPNRYMKMYLFSQGFSGLVSSMLRLITITVFTETIAEAFLYFSTGCVMMAMGLTLFFFASKTSFFKHYIGPYKEDAKKNVHSFKEILEAAKSIWKLILLNFLHSVVPIGTIINLVVSEYQGTGSTWGDTYFITVMSFLLGSISDIVGRGLSSRYDGLFSMPVLYVIVITRNVVYITLMMFTRAQPRHLPIYFGHDWQYGIIGSTYHLSGGYLMNVITLQTFKMTPKDKYEISLMLSMFFMGIFMGITSLLSLLMVHLL